MATLLSAATGNFTAAGTWLTVDATSLNDTETANTALTTAYQNSTAFTPGAIVVDGLAIKIASRAAGTPTNTLTVRLGLAGVDVPGTVTTMNVSDIDPCSTTAITANEGGWYYFRFNVAGTPTPVTLLAATAYTVGVKLSATTTAVNLYSLATTNWARMLATTTTAAPAAGDRLAICGDQISAGVSNTYTVTNNNTATTSFGSVSTQALTINKGATLTTDNTAATAYYLKVKGVIRVFSGGSFLVPKRTGASSFTLFHDSTSNVDSGLEIANGATVSMEGATKNSWTLLEADEAAAQTVIGALGSTSGWLTNDVLVFATTTRTVGQTETKIISTVDSATQVTLSAGLTNAHGGNATTKVQGEVGNLTRSVFITGASASLCGYIYIANTATVLFDYCAMTRMGSGTTSKRGIDVATTTGSCTISNCALYSSTVTNTQGIIVTGASSNNYTITDNILYDINSGGIVNASTTGTNYTISGNCTINIGSGGSGSMFFSDVGGTITDNRSAGGGAGAGIQFAATDEVVGTVSGNVAHSTAAGAGFTVSGSIKSGTISNSLSWRNSSYGLSSSGVSEYVFDDFKVFGNATAGCLIQGSGKVVINNLIANAGTTLTQPVGLNVGAMAVFELNSPSFGATETHATADVNVSSASTAYGVINNGLFSSSTEIALQSSLSPSSYIGSNKHDQTSGTNKMWRGAGTLSRDTTIVDVTPSLRMTPNNANLKLRSMPFSVACLSGLPVTLSIRVRESVVGDGTDYNGNRIRLIAKQNDSLGFTSDTVIATATASSVGAWETISGSTGTPSENGVIDFFVDCDGTTGWVNIDTLYVTQGNDTRSFKFWKDGYPVVYGDNNSGVGFIVV